MKKYIFVSLLTFAFSFSYSQIEDYTFSKSTEPYLPLAFAPKISTEYFLKGYNYFGYLLPFKINVKDLEANAFIVNNYGEIGLIQNVTDSAVYVMGFLGELSDLYGDGGVYGLMNGDTGKRIFRIELRNYELFFDADTPNTINCQVWFYEEDNSIEFRYGNNMNIKPTGYLSKHGPTVGIIDVDPNTRDYRKSFFLTGDAVTPSYNSSIIPGKTSDSTSYLSNNIPKNTVYRFTPVKKSSVGIGKKISKSDINIYPNPVAIGQNLSLSFDNPLNKKVTITLSSISGKQVFTAYTSENSVSIPVQDLSRGIYWVQMQSDSIYTVRKVIVE